jgi:glycerol-3-phosphate dehydrogenase subunit C
MRKEKKSGNRSVKKVAFFYGCFINFYRPDIGSKIVSLLSAMNVDVVLPPQWCCGLPALGNGNLALAKYFAQKNASSLSNYIDAGYDIVYACTSCGLCILHDYPGIMEIPQAKKITESSYNLHEYIIKLINEGYAKPEFGKVQRKIAYHIPCHLRALRIGYPAQKIMASIPGLECEVFDDTCCGLSGSYGFKENNEFTSIQIGNRAISLIKKTGAENIVADCGSCRMQLSGLSGMTALDPAEILCESLGINDQKSRV